MRTIWILAAASALGGLFAAHPAVAADQPAAVQPATEAKRAKIGDQVTCAVDGMQMPLEADTPSAEYHGQTYYFCSDDEKRTFLRDSEHNTKH